MSDLFAGLFGPTGAASRSSLFDDNSAFRSKIGSASFAEGLVAYNSKQSADESQHANGSDVAPKQKKRKKISAPDATAEVAPASTPDTSVPEDAIAADKKKTKKKKSSQEQPSLQQTPIEDAVGTSYAAVAHEDSKSGGKRQRRQQEAKDVESEDEDMRSKAQVAAAQKVQLTAEEKAERDAGNTEKLSRTLFVGNLPLGTTPKQLRQIFSRLGYPVDSARLRSVPVDPEAKIPRRSAILTGKLRASEGASSAGGANGYVVLTNHSDVAKAVTANMSEFNGHHLRVDRAAAPRKAATGSTAPTQGAAGMPTLFDAARSIFVGNVDFLVKDEDIIRFFNDERHAPELGGAVEAVRLVRDKDTNIGKGFGFVLFKSKVAARAALALDGQKLGKRPLRITRVTPDARPAQPAKPAARFSGTPGHAAGKARQVSASLATSDWQGTQTKGKGQGVRGPKAPSGGGATATPRHSSKPAALAPEGRQRNNKRPAVAARKKAALGRQGNASPKTFDKPAAAKKPRWVPRNSTPKA